MAALSQPGSSPEIVPLKKLVGRELDPVLLEETVEWQRELDWDFSKSADLVRQFTDMRSLAGFATIDRGEVTGYGYSVLEDHKGLIGDVYVRPPWRDGAAEARLFEVILDDLIATPNVHRVESQLLLPGLEVGQRLQDHGVQVTERLLMSLPVSAAAPMRQGKAFGRFYIEPWSDRHHEPAAGVIALSYSNHIDSQINDQYRTQAGARRFIYNIVQFPGCGMFFRPGSYVAYDLATGWLVGVVLTSFVSDQVGHITQICVIPQVKGRGLGYELLRQAIGTLRHHGAKRISLTVTTANTEAVSLYESVGFREVRRFGAYVWES